MSGRHRVDCGLYSQAKDFYKTFYSTSGSPGVDQGLLCIIEVFLNSLLHRFENSSNKIKYNTRTTLFKCNTATSLLSLSPKTKEERLLPPCLLPIQTMPKYQFEVATQDPEQHLKTSASHTKIKFWGSFITLRFMKRLSTAKINDGVTFKRKREFRCMHLSVQQHYTYQ